MKRLAALLLPIISLHAMDYIAIAQPYKNFTVNSDVSGKVITSNFEKEFSYSNTDKPIQFPCCSLFLSDYC